MDYDRLAKEVEKEDRAKRVIKEGERERVRMGKTIQVRHEATTLPSITSPLIAPATDATGCLSVCWLCRLLLLLCGPG